MTGEEVAALIREWDGFLSRPGPSVRAARPGSLRRPWQREGKLKREGGVAAGWDAAAEIDRPDFGIRFARRFVTVCHQRAFGRRRKRGLMRRGLGRNGLKWIRHAIRCLERTGEGASPHSGGLSGPQRAVREAINIDREPLRRGLLQRLLIAHEADPGRVARVLELDADAVAAYQELFFDFGAHGRDPIRVFAALDAPLADKLDLKHLPPLDECAALEFAAALQRCGLADHPEAGECLGAAGDFMALMRFQSAWRRVLLEPERIATQSTVVAHALTKYNGMEVELRKAKSSSLVESFIKPIEQIIQLAPPQEETGPEEVSQISQISQTSKEEEKWKPGNSPSRRDREMEKLREEAFRIMRELDEDSGSKPEFCGPEFAPLTAEDLGRVGEVWLQCEGFAGLQGLQGTQSPPRTPAFLRPAWKRVEAVMSAGLPEAPGAGPASLAVPGQSDEGQLAEMEQPDFGYRLARGIAGSGLCAKLPVDDSFHWIRLAAAGACAPDGGPGPLDACQSALRLAIDLHQRPAARQVLQLALITRDAGIGTVAAFLGLEPRVVAAYASLFFNVSGRRADSGFRHKIERRFAMGLDPLDGTVLPPGHGLEELRRAAPALALSELRKLMGVETPFNSPQDAARALLRSLSRQASGGGAQGAGGAGGAGERGGGGPRAKKNSPDFEAAVKSAGEMMKTGSFGSASIFSSLSDAFTKTHSGHHKWTEYALRMTRLGNTGLTEQQARESLETEKAARRANEKGATPTQGSDEPTGG